LDHPTEYALLNCYPNPFNPTTTISYSLPVTSNVELSIHNIQGQLVDKLVDKQQAAGYHEIIWHASDYTAGLYLCHIETGAFRAVRKMLLLK
jgi:hypothetical protein